MIERLKAMLVQAGWELTDLQWSSGNEYHIAATEYAAPPGWTPEIRLFARVLDGPDLTIAEALILTVNRPAPTVVYRDFALEQFPRQRTYDMPGYARYDWVNALQYR